MKLIAWVNSRPWSWAASIDGGKTYKRLKADNEEDSSEAIYEATEKFGGNTNDWDIADEPILKDKLN